MTGPTVRSPVEPDFSSPKGFRPGEIVRLLRRCPMCGEVVLRGLLASHCRMRGDEAHLVLEVPTS